MSELKPCPFCGEENTDTGFILHKDECYLMLRYMGGHSKHEMINAWNTRPIEDALQAEIDRLKETNKELLERLALLEKKIPQLTVDLAQASTCAYTSETARLQLIEIINGMFPMWIAAMSFCEHGKHDSLMRMRNYYNGRDNLLTSDQIHVMFSLIRGVGDERK